MCSIRVVLMFVSYQVFPLLSFERLFGGSSWFRLLRQAGGALVLLRCLVLGPVSYWFKLVRVIRQPFVVVG